MSRYSYNVRLFAVISVQSDSVESAAAEVKRVVSSCVVPGSGFGLQLDATPELVMVDSVGLQSETAQDM